MRINMIIENYKKQYSFLAFSEKSWKSLSERITKLVENKTLNSVDEIRTYLDRILCSYIDKQISIGNIRIIHNMLILLKRRKLSYSNLLQEFLSQLEIYHIHMTESFYEVLKKESVLYQNIVKSLGISDLKFCELSAFWKEYSFYFKFSVHGKSLKEVKDIFDGYYYSLNVQEQKQVMDNMDSHLDQFRYLIYHASFLDGIYQVCYTKIRDISLSLFRKVIFSWSIDQLDLLIEEYCYNQIYGGSALEKYDKIWLLIKELKPQHDEKKKHLGNECLKIKGERRTLYSYFEKIKSNLSEEDKKVIDTLYVHLSKERQEGIDGYINGLYHQNDEVGRKASNDISMLKGQFKKYLINGCLKVKGERRTLYSYFEKIKSNLSAEDRGIIDILYTHLSKERQEGIDGYISGLYHQNDEVGRKASNDISILKRQFKKYLQSGCLNLKNEPHTLYFYFRMLKSDLSEEDKKVIDTLYAHLSKERQEAIDGYISGLYRYNDNMRRKASNDILILKRQFARYLAKGDLTIRSKDRSLYSCFEKIKSNLSEEDRRIIDILYNHLSKERQEGIDGYINGLYHQNDEVGRKASNDISTLKRQFKKYLESGCLNLKNEPHTLYFYFKMLKSDLSEEDKKVIYILYALLSKEKQEEINGYINGLYHQSDEVRKKARIDLLGLRRKFERYLKIESLEVCSKKQLEVKQVLLDALKVIEMSFYRLGYTTSEYLKYKNEKMIEIMNKGNFSHYNILYIFIMESFYFIKEQEKIRSL